MSRGPAVGARPSALSWQMDTSSTVTIGRSGITVRETCNGTKRLKPICESHQQAWPWKKTYNIHISPGASALSQCEVVPACPERVSIISSQLHVIFHSNRSRNEISETCEATNHIDLLKQLSTHARSCMNHSSMRGARYVSRHPTLRYISRGKPEER